MKGTGVTDKLRFRIKDVAEKYYGENTVIKQQKKKTKLNEITIIVCFTFDAFLCIMSLRSFITCTVIAITKWPQELKSVNEHTPQRLIL